MDTARADVSVVQGAETSAPAHVVAPVVATPTDAASVVTTSWVAGAAWKAKKTRFTQAVAQNH